MTCSEDLLYMEIMIFPSYAKNVINIKPIQEIKETKKTEN